MGIITDTTITPISSSEKVLADGTLTIGENNIANRTAIELQAMMDEINEHHNQALTHNGEFAVDIITEATATSGVTIDGVLLKDSQVTTDVINEKTGAAGVTVDGCLIKDGVAQKANYLNVETEFSHGSLIDFGSVTAGDIIYISGVAHISQATGVSETDYTIAKSSGSATCTFQGASKMGSTVSLNSATVRSGNVAHISFSGVILVTGSGTLSVGRTLISYGTAVTVSWEGLYGFFIKKQ
jgi:hypothetical protein